ncbi:DUF2946 family protein [Pseudomonas lini]
MSLTRGSWISLFAMLMIFIGPLISQSMPMDQRASMSMSMPMDMQAMEHGAQPAAEHCPPKADHHALWEKNAAIAACCSIARRSLAVSPSSPSTVHRQPLSALPLPAWATPGKPSSPVPAPAPRPSSRKHPLPISHGLEDSRRLPAVSFTTVRWKLSCPGFLLTHVWALPRLLLP